MKNKYAKIMQTFFDSLDRKSEEDPSELALAFADYFSKSGMSKQALPVDDSNVNVSILARCTPLTFLTKRASLLADTTVLTHYNEAKHCFFYDQTDPWQVVTTGVNTYYLRCPNLNGLGKWLRECKPLLLSGDVFYFPDILVENYWDDYGFDRQVTTEQSVNPICDLIVENRRMAGILTTNPVKTKYFQPIVEIELPYIENVDLDTFSKIAADNRDAIGSFREFLRGEFLDLATNERNGFNQIDLERIRIQLLEGVRKLNSEFDIIKRERAFQVTGAVIATIGTVLVAVDSKTHRSLIFSAVSEI